MADNTPSEQPLRAARIAEDELERILDQLDAEVPDPKSQERAGARLAMRKYDCSVTIRQPGSSSPATFLVPTRNLGAGGMSFLYGNFVHAGSTCAIRLLALDDSVGEISGVVVRCRYVDQMIHEVAVKFDEAIQTSRFCEAAAELTILLVEDDETAARAATHHLTALQVDVDRPTDTEQTVEMANSGRYDGILIGMDLAGTSAVDLTRQLRENGYRRMIIGATDDPEGGKETLAAGCDRHLTKPYTPDALKSLVRALAGDEPNASAA